MPPPQHDLEKWRYEQTRLSYELYAKVQVDADATYYYRTNLITVTEGLLLVAYEAMAGKSETNGVLAASVLIAAAGAILSALWFLFEQRNQIYFQGRAAVLRQVEESLDRGASSLGIQYVPMWKAVPDYVKTNAKRFQRVSAPLIVRTLLPLMFGTLWVALLIVAPFVATRSAPDKSCAAIALAANHGNLPAALHVCQQLK